MDALRTAAFDANDPASLERFFLDLPAPIDHVMVTGPGPRYWPLMEIEFEQARLAISEHVLLALWVARNAAGKIRPWGTLLFMGGTGARHPARGLALVSAATAAMPAFVAGLALDLAPVRGGFAAAQYVFGPVTVQGITLPTKRKAYKRDPGLLFIHDQLMVSIDLSDVSCNARKRNF